MIHQTSTSPIEQSRDLSVPIVAIGASAGGLEAVSELLANLSPVTNLAYIYIQHPDGSTLDSNALVVLSRATIMTVVEAEDQMSVQPNRVYVIMPPVGRSDQDGAVDRRDAPERDLEVIDGVLTFVVRSSADRLCDVFLADDLPIDRFFMALANRQRDGAIAVLLSGTTSDGTLGMRAIRAAGGLTFAQDETARFQTMPRLAIIEGVVDRVLSPAEIARELEQLSRQSVAFRLAARANALEYDEPGERTGQPVRRPADKSISDEDPAVMDSVAVDSDESSARQSEALEQATDEDVQSVIQLLRQTTGADFSHYKMTTIRRRVVRRMLLLRLETLRDYADYLRERPDESRALYDDLLINVTTFFRDANTMEHLQKTVLPQLIRDRVSGEPLRIWVPACSTGQEAYSIAMLLLEVLGERATSVPIQFFGTDLSDSAVAKARLGSYTRSEVMDVSTQRLQRFFTKVDDHYRVNKAVRDLCVFAPHNLLKDPPFSRLDFVSCRNLLIYLDAQLQRKAIATFHYALNSSGYLLLGKSETVGQSSPFFSVAAANHKIYTRKNDLTGRVLFDMHTRAGLMLVAPVQPGTARTARPLRSGTEQPGPDRDDRDGGPGPRDDGPPTDGSPDGSVQTATVPVSRMPKTARPANDLDRAVDSLLLSQHVPASVVVNMDLDILQFRGSTGLFLEPATGRASLNLLKMARPTLAFDLRNIILKAGQSGQPVRRSGLEVRVKDQLYYVALNAVPFRTDADERLFLVLFEEMTVITTDDGNTADARSRRISQLENELATLRDDMHSVIEDQEDTRQDLQSANEEVVSSNEELQSINEELETGKEEIESTNEELLTINQELLVRNDQLWEAQEFAEAIFSTIREATLVLTPDLRVKGANSVFYALFGLSESETNGRLLYELANRQWDSPQLRSLLTDVATRNEQIRGFELTYALPGGGDKVLSLNARRVVRQQEAILLAIEDITEQRRAQRLLEEREAWFHQIADNAPTLIWVAGSDGRYSFINEVWLQYTGHPSAEVTPGDLIQWVHPDDRARYEQTYRAHFGERQPFRAEYRLRRHDGDYYWMLENARPTYAPDGQFTGFIGTATNVQEQKDLNAELDRRVAEQTLQLTTANEGLARSNATIGQMLDGSMTAVCLMESVRDETGAIADFVFRGVNRAAETINQMSETELLGERFLVHFPGAKDVFFADYVRVVETGEPLRTERYYRGEHFDSWFDVSAVKNGDGFIMTFFDTTNRRQAEEQIRQTAGALQAVLDSSAASIGLLQAIRTPSGDIEDFQVVVANQRFAQLMGQSLEQVNKLKISQLTDKLWGSRTLDNLTRVVEIGEPFYDEHQRPDAGWLALSVTKQGDNVVLIGLDITDLKQMQQQREDLLDQVRQSSETVQQLSVLQGQVRARGELLRTSSHDLRGSLGIIQGAANLIAFADSDDERAQMLDMMHRNVQETTRLITELLDLSRLEAGQQRVQFAPLDAAELLHKLGENIRPLVEGKGLSLHLSGVMQLSIEGDALGLLRMAQNLLLNALKYTAQGGITMRWGSTGPDEWFFSVDDTGPGMEPDLAYQLSHVASPNEVAASTAADGSVPASLSANERLLSAPGEGIGLVIVRQLCDLLRGRLLVESQPGRGSVFRVLLPRRY